MSKRAGLTPNVMNPGIGAAPIAEQRPEKRSMHGTSWEDEYFWLKDPGYPEVKDPDILSYLEAENSYYEKAFQPHEELVEGLVSEFRGRIKDDDESVPVKDGDWFYRWTFESGADHKKHWRLPAGMDPVKAAATDWQLIIDEPAMAADYDSFRLGTYEVSPDGRLLAISTDTDGAERFTVSFRDISGSADLPDTIPNTIGGICWLPDNKSLIYVELSEQWRPWRVRVHVLGTPVENDPVIYEEADSGFWVSADYTSDRRWLLISAGDHVTSEARFLNPSSPLEEARIIAARKTGHQYFVDHDDSGFVIRTNDKGRNFRLVRADDSNPGMDGWRELIPVTEDHYLESHRCFKDYILIADKSGALRHLDLLFADGSRRRLEFDEEVFTVDGGDNREFDQKSFRLEYQSMVTPPSVLDYHVDSGERRVLKEKEIPSGYDKDLYETRRLWATARDGARIPLSLVMRRDRPGGGPLALYGYGAYSYGIPAHFNSSMISMLDRGFAYVIAHIRGGDEMGYGWYEAGKLRQRTNTFHDFVDSARFLIDQGITEAGRISIFGGSAGGELMGAVLNEAPELWCAAAALVPFVDVLNTMLDKDLPLTPGEWPEWGNPIESEEDFHFIRSYSPYDQVEEKEYPPILITAGFHDPRVTYWEPAKWAARLRTRKTDSNVLLLTTEMGAGHAGKLGRFTRLRKSAEYFAFFLLASGKGR